MNKEDKKIQKHLIDEIMKVSKTNPEVILYMESLMIKYEELEQKNKDLSQQLLSKKISDKDIEYNKRKEAELELDKYKNIIDGLEQWLDEETKLKNLDEYTLKKTTERLHWLQYLESLKGE